MILDIIIDYINEREQVDLRSRSRNQRLANLRFIYYYAAVNIVRDYFPYSFITGKVNRHHAGLVSGLKVFNHELKEQKWVKLLLDELRTIIKPSYVFDVELSEIKEMLIDKINEIEGKMILNHKNPFLQECLKVPEEHQNDFIETRLKPYLKMNKVV